MDLELEKPARYVVLPTDVRETMRGYARQYDVPCSETERHLDAESKGMLLRAVARAFGLRTFVETGSHEGETIACILQTPSPVDRVLSVEMGDEVNPGAGNWDTCDRRFKGDRRVSLFRGDSAIMLPRMHAHFDGPALYWLDAHANGPEDPVESHFPLRTELTWLFGEHGARAGSVVLVDDARFFGLGFWPTLPEVMAFGSSAYLSDDIVRIIV